MRVTRRIEIARRPAEVWPVLEDPEEMKRWMPGLVDVLPGEGSEAASEGGALGPGTRFVMKMREPRDKLAHYDGEVLDWEPPKRLRMKLWGGSFKENETMFGEFLLNDLADGRTRLVYDVRKDLEGWLLKTLQPLIWVLGHLHLARVMRAIRRRAEAGGGDRAAGPAEQAGAAS